MQPKWRYPTPVVTPVNFYAPLQPATLYHAPIAPALPVVPLSTLYGAPAAPKPEPLATLYAAPAPPAPKTEPLPTLYNAPAAPRPEPLPTLYAAPAPPAPEPDQSNIDIVEENLNAMMQMDASYSFKYDNEFSSREETADPNGDVKGCSRHFLKVEV